MTMMLCMHTWAGIHAGYFSLTLRQWQGVGLVLTAGLCWFMWDWEKEERQKKEREQTISRLEKHQNAANSLNNVVG